MSDITTTTTSTLGGVTTTTTTGRVELDYTSRDFAAIRSMLVGLAKGLVPEWTTVGETADFGTLLLELMAYASDVNNFYVDRMASEAFLGTAVRRQSMLYIADMFGYTPVGQRSATVPVQFTWSFDSTQLAEAQRSYTIDSGAIANGIATLVISSTVYTINLIEGQTVTVIDLGDEFDGTYVLASVTPSTTDSTVTVTYRTANADVATFTATGATLDTGQTVVVPAGTKLFTSPEQDGSVITFELSSNVILNGAEAEPIPGSDTLVRVQRSATASEGITVAPTKIAVSKGVPNAEFILENPGVIDGTVSVFTVEGGQAIYWSPLQRLAVASSTQSAFTTYVDDDNYTHVVFGDKSSGRIPPVNADIYVGYRTGVGAAANSVPVNTLVNISNSWVNQEGVLMTNTASPSGGADVESLASMRVSIPKSVSLRSRAVTVDDFTSLALQVKGINKAVAYGSNYTSIYIRVAGSSQSVGYLTDTITHKVMKSVSTTSRLGTLVLDTDPSLNLSQDYYVVIDGGGDTDFDGARKVSNLFLSHSSVVVTRVQRTGNVGKLTLATNPGFPSGQPIQVSGVTNNSGVFNGTWVVSSSDPGDTSTGALPWVKFDMTAGSDIADAAATGGTPALVGLPGVSFTTPVSGTPYTIPATASGVIKYLDADMNILITSLEAYLSDKKLVGSVVYGEPVVWSDVLISAVVHVRQLFNRTAVINAVQSAIEDVFSFDAVDFGKRISVGDVYRAALAVDGVDYLTLTEMRLDGTTPSAWTTNTLYYKGDLVTECGRDWECAIDHLSGVFTADTGAGLWVEWDPVQDIVTPSYNLPRIKPSLATPWVTATGGLANT